MLAAALTLTAAGLALAATASAHPSWVVAPRVDGVPQEGGYLEARWLARAGHYTVGLNDAPWIERYEVAWQRCTAVTCTDIAETSFEGWSPATSGHPYIPKAADVGLKLRFKVTAYDQPPEYGGDSGVSTMYSNMVGPVTPKPSPGTTCGPGEIGAPPACVDEPDLSSVPGNYSDTCTAPTAKVADGFAGSAYVKLRVQQSSGETWVCARASDGSSIRFGGRFTVEGAPGARAPEVDQSAGSSARCVQAGPAADPYDGTVRNSKVHVSTHVESGQTWVCVRVEAETGQTVERRVVMYTGTEGGGAPRFDQDAPPVADPARSQPPAGSESAKCYEQAERDLVNMDVGAGHVWLASWQPSSARIELCVRSQGYLNWGGRVVIDVSNVPGASVALEESKADMAPCTQTEVSQGQIGPVPAFAIRDNTNDTGKLTSQPSVCVEVGSTKQRVTLKVTGTPTAPTVSWRPDPSTPVPAIG